MSKTKEEEWTEQVIPRGTLVQSRDKVTAIRDLKKCGTLDGIGSPTSKKMDGTAHSDESIQFFDNPIYQVPTCKKTVQ